MLDSTENPTKYSDVQHSYSDPNKITQSVDSANDPERIKQRTTAAQLCAQKFLKPEESIRLLEYGAGVGNYMRILLKEDPYYHNPNLTVNITAVDLAEPALEYYKKNVPEGRTNVTVNTLAGNIAEVTEQLPGNFDNAIAFGVGEITPTDSVRVWEAILSKLEEKGVLIFDFINANEGPFTQHRSRQGFDYYRYSPDFIREKIAEIGESQGHQYNIEFIPFETIYGGEPLSMKYCIIRKQPTTTVQKIS